MSFHKIFSKGKKIWVCNRFVLAAFPGLTARRSLALPDAEAEAGSHGMNRRDTCEFRIR